MKLSLDSMLKSYHCAAFRISGGLCVGFSYHAAFLFNVPKTSSRDLRSSTVNNENFARAAVKYNIQKYLCHDSESLMNQITKFVTYVDQIKEAKCEFKYFGGTEVGPKASKYHAFLTVTSFLCTFKKE